jgi:hypothetical protein
MMFIGDVFFAQGLVTRTDISAALELQGAKGGELGDCLVELGTLKACDLEAVIEAAPPLLHSIADTGVSLHDLLNLLIKAMYASGQETPSMMGDFLKLPPPAVQELIDEADQRQLLHMLGAVRLHAASELRYGLTEKGMQWAHDAMRQNQYVGPAPVPLSAYCEQIARQRIANEHVDAAAIEGAFADLVVSEILVRKIGPAINSGRSILLYGPPGNGKTTVAEKVAKLFSNVVYIPYCFEVDGQIVKVFDPGIHKPVRNKSDCPAEAIKLHRDDFDLRWEACWRPVIITGGELTLEMLDLSFNEAAKFYEAPLHIKALGGVLLVDDFGRQLVSPKELLNRWIVPLESRVDYLKLHTGKSFQLPFDELVIFSTNLAPNDLMDAAFLRRIPYKIEVHAPTAEEYRRIFKSVSKAAGVEVTDAALDYVVAEMCVRNDFPLASYQPKFILDQIRAACKYEAVPLQLRPDLIDMALSNLFTEDSPGYGVNSAPSKTPGFPRAA